MKFNSTMKNVMVSATTAVAQGISARFLRRLVATMIAPITVRISIHSSRLPDCPPHSAPNLYAAAWEVLE